MVSFDDMALLLKNKTEEQFRVNIAQAFDNTRALGCNTVYVHAELSATLIISQAFMRGQKTVPVQLAYRPDMTLFR